jgi:hypothetical protein
MNGNNIGMVQPLYFSPWLSFLFIARLEITPRLVWDKHSWCQLQMETLSIKSENNRQAPTSTKWGLVAIEARNLPAPIFQFFIHLIECSQVCPSKA